MIHDALFSAFVSALKKERHELTEALATAQVADMYRLGQLQGRIQGLTDALNVLENVLNDQDE